MAFRGKTMIFLRKLVYIFIYPIHFGQYKGKTKFLRKIFSGEKWVFLSNFEFSLLMARGPPKMQIFWNFLVILYSDPIRIALKLCSHFCLWKSWNHLRITHSYYNVRRIKQIDYIIIQTIIPLIHYVNFE